jgi:hypothetical protein
MWKVSALALALLPLLAAPASALELKSLRAAYGLLSAPRQDAKYLPGDVVMLAYELEDLKIDPKTGVAKIRQAMEITDKDQKVIFGKNPKEGIEVPLFGATRMPGLVHAVMTFDTPPGKYKVKVTVTDEKAKTTKSLEYPFELLKEGFGIVQPTTPAVAFVGQDFIVTFWVVGMSREKKSMLPDVEVRMKLLGEDGKALVPFPVINNMREFHNEGVPEFDLRKLKLFPFNLPLPLTQKGKFFIEVQAEDRLAKETATLRLPLTVLDPAPYLKTPARISQ